MWDAIWDVAEDEFGGNGDMWSDEFQDGVLGKMAEPLLASGTNAGLGYSEHLSLLDFGPGLCFAAFEPGEGEDWQFVERVDPTDTERLRVLTLDAYCFGRGGGGDPSQPVDWVDVYPPLRLEDIWDGQPPPTSDY